MEERKFTISNKWGRLMAIKMHHVLTFFLIWGYLVTVIVRYSAMIKQRVCFHENRKQLLHNANCSASFLINHPRLGLWFRVRHDSISCDNMMFKTFLKVRVRPSPTWSRGHCICCSTYVQLWSDNTNMVKTKLVLYKIYSIVKGI